MGLGSCSVSGLMRTGSSGFGLSEQFVVAAITNYFVWRSRDYDYTVSGVNEYYRSILEMSLGGWPGGLRWLHGEDRATTKSWKN